MANYSIYTYQFERVRKVSKQQLEFEDYPPSSCTDEEWDNRLETFRSFFRKDIPLEERTFVNGRSTYVYDTIFIEGHIAIMKFGRLSKKNVTNIQLNEHKIEDYPWCYIIWDNRDGIQRMLIEQKPSAWNNSKTITGTKKVAKAVSLIIDHWLSNKKGMHFNFGDGPVFKANDFWEYVDLYPQGFSKVHFSFPPPNLGRLMTLADSIAGIRNETGGSFDAELKAPEKGVLSIKKENIQTSSLVDLSSACGKEIRLYPKGGHMVIKVSGDNLSNDVVVEINSETIPTLCSRSLFGKNDFEEFVETLNSIKNLY